MIPDGANPRLELTSHGRIALTSTPPSRGNTPSSSKRRRGRVRTRWGNWPGNRDGWPWVRVAVAPSRDAPVADDARVLETPKTVRAGRPAVLRLTFPHAFGNDAAYSAARGAETIATTLDSDGANPSLELVARLGDNNDGTYDLTFRPTVAGTYALSATLGGADVPALAGRDDDGDARRRYPPASTTTKASVGVAGAGCAFEIIARDQFGNAHHAGDETFALTVTPPAGAAAVVGARVEPTTDGTYAVTRSSPPPPARTR